MANVNREAAEAVMGLLQVAGLRPTSPGLLQGDPSNRHYVVHFSNARISDGKVVVYSPTKFSVQTDETQTFNDFFELRRYVATQLSA